MIDRHCDTCKRHTPHEREQWAEDATIHTDYTCTHCGTVDSDQQDFPTDERKANRT
jgi:5-methylcytosine-specific restriction endonuclease McrA